MIELIAHGSYWEEKISNYAATSRIFTMEDDAFLGFAKPSIRPLPTELLEVVSQLPPTGTWLRFYAWEAYHENTDYRAGWFVRVEELIKGGSYFGSSVATVMASFTKYPITVLGPPKGMLAPATKPKYTIAQCWYAKEVDEEAKRKAFSEATMAAVRELSRGNA